MSRTIRLGAVFALASILVSGGSAHAQPALPELSVSSFPSPSTSYWFAALIPALGLDEKHGFRLTVTAKPSQAAYSDFVSGADQACYCIATGAAARFLERGVDVRQLWNVQTYEHILVTSDAAINSAKDLEGRSLGADTTTGSWAIFRSLLARSGVDLEKVEIRSSPISTNLAELSQGRLTALATSTSLDYWRVDAREPGKYRAIQIADSEAWQKLTGEPGTPGWGFGVRAAWLEAPGNRDLAGKLYAASRDLVDRIRNEPDTIALEVEKVAGIEPWPLARSFRENWSFHLAPIKDFEKSVRLLGSELLPEGGVLKGPLTEEQYGVLIADFEAP